MRIRERGFAMRGYVLKKHSKSIYILNTKSFHIKSKSSLSLHQASPKPYSLNYDMDYMCPISTQNVVSIKPLSNDMGQTQQKTP
jgi:hypothetical protein